jgi:hypothetical protein
MWFLTLKESREARKGKQLNNTSNFDFENAKRGDLAQACTTCLGFPLSVQQIVSLSVVLCHYFSHMRKKRLAKQHSSCSLRHKLIW